MSHRKFFLLVDLSSNQAEDRGVRETYGGNQVDVEVVQAKGLLKFLVSSFRASLAVNSESLENIS